MRKFIENALLSGKVVLTLIILILGLYTWFYLSYKRPKNIQYSYNGIMYQIGNLQSSESIRIEIKGELTRELFGEHGRYGEFNCTIKVGDKIFTDSSIAFNKYKMGALISYGKQYGMIFIKGVFEKLTIEADAPNGNGGYSWSGRNGWMISAPCSNRIRAIEISNILTHKLYKGFVIK